MSETRLRPRALHTGSCVGVCAPAGPMLDTSELDANLAWLESSSLRVRCGDNLRGRRGYLAGTDAERAHDLLALVRDPEVDAILFARGGYGVSRILPDLDAAEIVASRKLFIGYSDFTSFALWLYRAGLATLHGPMLERSDVTGAARARLLALALGDPAGLEPIGGKSATAGRVRAPLVGGNLRMLAASLGTPWELDTRGAILFMEDVGEQPYAVDRSIVQLRAAGKLDDAVGVAVGHFENCCSERYPETTVADVFEDVLLPAVHGPAVVDLPFGHIADNRALGVGIEAELDGDAGTLRMIEPVVEGLS